MSEKKARLRFAPSPTGPLHIGGARTAIYNWAAARALGGRFILRIEDTDRARSSEESLKNILEAFRWLGIDWDEGPEQGGEHGPYLQSQRLDLYARFAEELLEKELAYRCYCTPEEVEAGREALRAQGRSPQYDRRCRNLTQEERAMREGVGRTCSLRFRMPEDEVLEIQDLGKGEVRVNLKELDDWVMVRAGGMPLYNFACVVDDWLMEITHVVRGEEHFMNGVKQLVLFRALGRTPPEYAHIPLILSKSGKKLSKREASTAVLEYRDQGFPADAIFNYIALLGWSFSGDRDLFTRDEMVERFRIEDIGKSGARFDSEKLDWMSGDYIRRMDIEELLAAVEPWLLRDGAVPKEAPRSHRDLILNLLRCHQERVRRFGEMSEKLSLFFGDGVDLDPAASKNLNKHPDARKWLGRYAGLLERSDLPPSYPADRGEADRLVTLPSAKDAKVPERGSVPFLLPAHLEEDARGLAGDLGVKFGHLVHPIRSALTGTNKGPGLFDCVYLLGKECCLARLRAQAE